MIKISSFHFGALFFGAMVLVSAAQRETVSGIAPVIKDRPTHGETLKRQKPVSTPAEARTVNRDDVMNTKHRNERQKQGLMSRSAILSSSTEWTLVPKGAVLYVPKSFESRVNDLRSGKLIGWQEFFGNNRAWIRTVSVTIEQASGREPLTEEYLQALQKGGQVLVATCQGGPISVKLPDVAPAADAPAAPNAAEEAAPPEEDETTLESQAVERLKRRLMQRGN